MTTEQPEPQPEPDDADNPANDRALSPQQAASDLILAGILDVPELEGVAKTALRGLISGLSPRAQIAVLALAAGEPRRSVAIRLGLSLRTLGDWFNTNRPLREAVEFAEMAAMAPAEMELYRRALAGKDDRGSIRALEIFLKSKDASYRDQSSVELHVTNAARREEIDTRDEWVKARDVTPT